MCIQESTSNSQYVFNFAIVQFAIHCVNVCRLFYCFFLMCTTATVKEIKVHMTYVISELAGVVLQCCCTNVVY